MMRSPIASTLLLLGLAGTLAVRGFDLPVSPYEAKMDGDPREAFLLGAVALPMYDPVTGARDGSVRAFALGTREGLYVAVLSTEPRAGEGAAPGGARGAERDLPVAGGRIRPDEVLAGEWMAVRLRLRSDLLFFLVPDGRFLSTGGDGAAPGLDDISWMARGSHFGHTWAGEWLLPWDSLWVKGGDRFEVAVLRGRKHAFGPRALESLSASSAGLSAARWGGEGVQIEVPKEYGTPRREPAALAPFDVRPHIPASAGRPSCLDSAPAGETATAWLDLPPSPRAQRVEVEGALTGAEVFRVDFWWQAGTREEQDALLPSRVAAGLGDVLVAERLFPQPPEGFAPAPWPSRVYLRCRVPKSAAPGLLKSAIRVRSDGKEGAVIPWEVRVAPLLPPSDRLAGLYYGEKDAARWGEDFADMAAHGFNAVTCPAPDADSWRRFVEEAREAGMSGAFAMRPTQPSLPGAWAYTVDEPATEASFSQVREISQRLRSSGFKTWTALCWPNSLSLADVLDGYALSPGLVEAASRIGLTERRWTYIQGLREDPAYNRLMAGVFAHAGGMEGLWVFSYIQGDGTQTDWSSPPYRHDACVENGPEGTRIQTVQWEALREGILESQLREALGDKAAEFDQEFPELQPVLQGRYWELDRAQWDFEKYRRDLVEKWKAVARN